MIGKINQNVHIIITCATTIARDKVERRYARCDVRSRFPFMRIDHVRENDKHTLSHDPWLTAHRGTRSTMILDMIEEQTPRTRFRLPQTSNAYSFRRVTTNDARSLSRTFNWYARSPRSFELRINRRVRRRVPTSDRRDDGTTLSCFSERVLRVGIRAYARGRRTHARGHRCSSWIVRVRNTGRIRIRVRTHRLRANWRRWL